MDSNFLKTSIIFVFFAVFMLECHAANLEEAISTLDDWEKSFASIRVRSRITSESQTNFGLADSGLDSAWGDLDFIWEDSGRFRDESASGNSSGYRGRSLRLADAKNYYVVDFDPRKAERSSAQNVTIHTRSSEVTSFQVLNQPFHVLWDDGTRTWLADRLRKVSDAGETGEGFLEFDGEPVGFKEHVVRLDPAHGYLPISYAHTPSGSKYEVHEFQEVRPGFWFPKRGKMLAVIVGGHELWQSWEVKSVELNPELPDSLFKPPLGPETWVMNAVTGKNYWHGGKPPADRVAAAAAAKAGLTPVNAAPAAAIPDRAPDWMWPGLALVGIACVAAAVWIRRRG